MEKQQYSILVHAPKEKVWDVLWSDHTYPQWASAFAEGSRADSDWKQGSRILFSDGKGQGMIAEIVEKRDHEFMSFRHLGMLKDGVEDVDSEAVKQWAGALESYTLSTVDGQTELLVDMDVWPEFKEYFAGTWPRALEKIKSLAES